MAIETESQGIDWSSSYKFLSRPPREYHKHSTGKETCSAKEKKECFQNPDGKLQGRVKVIETNKQASKDGLGATRDEPHHIPASNLSNRDFEKASLDDGSKTINFEATEIDDKLLSLYDDLDL
jgi:hypothetical protein